MTKNEFSEEMIDDRIEDGMSTECAIDGLGNLDDIVEQSVLELSIPSLVKARVNKSSSKASVLKLILIIVGSPIWGSLLIAAISVIFSLYISVWAIMVGIFAINISLLAVVIASLVNGVIRCAIGQIGIGIIMFGIAFICLALALLMFRPCVKLSKYIIELTGSFLKKIKLLIIGRERNE